VIVCTTLLLLICALSVGRDLLDVLGTKELRVGIRIFQVKWYIFQRMRIDPAFVLNW